MTLLEQLQAHKGGLICLKTELYWYDRRSWDGTPGRICLILNAAVTSAPARSSAHTRSPAAARSSAYLLIDGQPQWIWVAEADMALLVNDPPAN